jgi:hypothetical protein
MLNAPAATSGIASYHFPITRCRALPIHETRARNLRGPSPRIAFKVSKRGSLGVLSNNRKKAGKK